MEFVLVVGTAQTAPACANGVPPGPSWAGKRMHELTKNEMDDILNYCMQEGRRRGYADTMDGWPELINPFHEHFLHGMPWAQFRTFYDLGRNEAMNEIRARQTAERLQLAAA